MYQLGDGTPKVTMAQTYEPYGEVLSSAGEGESSYAYAGEWTDTTGLQYLRARYMNSAVGRFITRDIWKGVPMEPMSFNFWLYGYGNPVMFTDPSGAYSLGFDSLNSCQKMGCGELADLIYKLMDELEERATAIIENPLDLPFFGKNMSVESHQFAFSLRQGKLKKAMNDYINNGCGGPPDGADYYAFMPIPEPRSSSQSGFILQTIPDNIEEIVLVGAGGVCLGVLGYILYNLKGCIFGPAGCFLDFATPFP